MNRKKYKTQMRKLIIREQILKNKQLELQNELLSKQKEGLKL